MLQYVNEIENEDLEQYDYVPASVNECFARDSQALKEAMFSRLISANGIAVDNIIIFQKDMIRTANPLVGTTDAFSFELKDCNETTKSGASCAMIRSHINMGIMVEEVDTRYQLVGKDRYVFAYGDQLMETRLKDLESYVMKSLTKI